MINLVFIVGFEEGSIPTGSEDQFGDWIQDELYTILSNEDSGDEKIICTYAGNLCEVCDCYEDRN